jgi:DNA-binding Lrp family transcriptional regulator
LAKINPATKQVEEAKDPTVQEMLDNYGEYKENSQLSTNKFSDEVQERLPDHAEIKKGNLTVPSPKRERNSDGQPINYSFTDLRRKIIKALAENPDKSQLQISKDLDISDTSISYAKKGFGFLLDDPVLFDAFVLTGRTYYSDESEESEESEDSGWSDRSHKEIVNDHYGENDDIVDKALKEVEDEDNSPESCGTTMTDAYSTSEDSADTSEQDSRVRTSHNTKADGFSPEQLTTVLDGLFLQGETDLVQEIITEMMEE